MIRTDQFSKSGGFTLIEMLVVIAIIVLLVGGGIAGFLTFKDKQTILDSVKQLKTYIQLAQSYAQSGELPDTGCIGYLDTYSLRFDSADSLGCTANNLCLVAICIDPVGGVTQATRNEQPLPDGVTVSALPNYGLDLDFDFRILAGGVCLDGDCTAAGPSNSTITVGYNGASYEIIIQEGGEVIDDGWTP